MMEMRRKDRKLTEEEAIELLKNTEYGVLSTVSADGIPYGVPISFAYLDGVLYMHCAKAEGHKLLNIKYSNKASFTVVDYTEVLQEAFSTRYQSAIAFGQIEVVTDKEVKKAGLMEILRKYSPDFMDKGIQYMNSALDQVCVLKFAIEEVSAKGRKN